MPDIEKALHRIARLALRAADPAEAIQSIVGEIRQTFDATYVAFALVDATDGALTIEATDGLARPLRHNRLQARQGLMGWCAFHGRPVLLPDVAGDWRYLPLHPEVTCEMTCPLGTERQTIGVVSAGHVQRRRWTDEDLQALQALCDEATLVLRSLWNTEQLQRKANQLAVLISIGQKLVAKFDQNELLESLTREALRLVGCPLATLHLFGPQRDSIRLTAVASVTGSVAKAPEMDLDLPLNETLIGSVVQTRKQLEVQNVLSPEYLDCADIPREQSVCSLLSTPMLSEGEIIGALSIFTSSPHRFSNDERRLLSALASMGAVAIQNSRLYARVFQSEEHLQRSEKLTTLGLLAAEIAHEIRNPLTVLKLLFGSLGLDFPEQDPRRQDVAIIGEKLDQLEAIVSRVLSFGRAPTAVHSRMQLDSVIGDTLLLVRLKLKQSRIECVYEPSPEPLYVDANRGQLQQVFLNVIINAAQAMQGGGTLTVKCRHGGMTEPGVEQALVEVCDTGHGIPDGFAMRIFDSFLSGRPDGTGLGLAITKRILISHRGDIEVASTGSNGTVMRIRLPIAP